MSRPYRRTTVDWSDPAQVNAYKRAKQAEWRKRNPERYRAAVTRWQTNRKLRECGLTNQASVDYVLTRGR